MFCTKCGKELHEGDLFCAHCGNRVRTAAPENNMSKYSEVVFNPPFKIEAQRRTEEISQEVKQYSREPKRESLQFDWNLDGFPGSSKKKEEDFKFNWDDVLEKKKDSREIDVEKILFVAEGDKKEEKKEEKPEEPKAELAAEIKKDFPAEDLFADKSKDSRPLSIEELERELFGDAPVVEDKQDEDLKMTRRYEGPKDKFYTYNAKKDAFQELLDKERERVQQMEAERKAQWDDLTPTEEQLEKKPNEALSFEDVFQEPKIFTGAILREVAVVLPPLTPTVMACEEEPEKAAEVAKEVPPFQEEQLPDSQEKTKLRYSDIFPVEDIDAGNGGDDDDSDDSGKEEVKPLEKKIDETQEAQKPKKKGNPVLKFIIILLAIVVLAEVAVIGVKLAAPESEFALKVDEIVGKITSVFTGGEDEEATIKDFINNLAGNVAGIGTVKAADDLKYDLTKTYAFDEIAQSEDFENSAWIENSDGTEITYGQGIIEGLITYYDQLKTNNQLAEGLVGINKLEIGEIRTGGTGYYVLCKVTYEGEDGDVVKHETVCLEAGDQLINVKEVKEETL